MTCSWAKKNYRWYYKYQKRIRVLDCFVLFLVSILMLTACDPDARLTVENRLPTDIVIIHIDINSEGELFLQEELGTVPANQTTVMRYAIFLGNLGETVIIKAQDPQGNIVWQKRWSDEDFWKLKDVGWKIVISPETGSQN